jgi:endonuclease/exonuclease/phosphatase (EEP) superfamily protein YafD
MAMVDPNPVDLPARHVAPLERRILLGLTAVAWTGSAGLLVFVGLRVTGHDGHPLVATAESLTLYLMLPSWLVVGFAIGTRQRALFAVGVLLASTHLVWLYPEVHAGVPISRAARGAQTLRVFTANLLDENHDVRGIVDEVRTSGADIVLLQELGRQNRAVLGASGVLDAYPYRIEFVQDSPFGALLASKLPFVDADLVDIGGLTMPHAVVTTAIGPVEVICVHTNRPVTRTEFRGWTAQHAALAARVRARTMPLIFAGDFNATTSHRPFRDLLGAGITDANRARGEGLSNSWPNDRAFPPLIRIDHVLATSELVPRHVRNGTGAGSDHVPLVVDLALVGRAS